MISLLFTHLLELQEMWWLQYVEVQSDA